MATLLRTGEVFRHLVAGLRSDGIDPRVVFADALRRAPDDALLGRLLAWADQAENGPLPCANAQVSVTSVWTAWESVLAVTRTLGSPFRYAAMIPSADSVSVARMVFTTAPSVGESARRFVDVAALVAQAYRFSVVELPDGAGALRIDDVPETPGAAADVVFLVSAALRWVQHMLGSDPRPSMRFLAPWEGCEHDLASALAMPTCCSEAGYALEFGADLWSGHAKSDDAALAARLAEQARRELELLRPRMTTRVRRALAENPANARTVTQIARRCGVSSRTLRRELLEESSSCRALLDESRCAEAFVWLPRESDGELAARLGFSDARAFRRAFAAWTGKTPTQVRSA